MSANVCSIFVLLLVIVAIRASKFSEKEGINTSGTATTAASGSGGEKNFPNNGTNGHENKFVQEGRKHNKKSKESLIMKILPMMVIPFMVQTSMIPMMLVSLKVMLMKTFFIGKLALLLLAINALWRLDNSGGGVYSHNINVDHELTEAHYGYKGSEEVGAYWNRRRRRRK